MIREEFEAKLVEQVNNIKVGHPLDPATEIGPLVSEEHYNKVVSYFDIAKDDGATIAAGGQTVGDKGYFIRPTLFDLKFIEKSDVVKAKDFPYWLCATLLLHRH